MSRDFITVLRRWRQWPQRSCGRPPAAALRTFYTSFDDKCTSGKGKVYAKHLSLLLDVGIEEMDANTASDKWVEIMDSVNKTHQCERKEWEKVLENEIQPYYRNLAVEAYPKVDSFKSLLELRVVPPILVALKESSRASSKTESRKRRYPPEVQSWSNFKEKVQEYQPEAPKIDLTNVNGFYHRYLFTSAKIECLANELQEQTYLLNVLGFILASTEARPRILTHAGGVKGKPDFHMTKGEEDDEEPVLVGEMKSTQTLFLPELSSDVVSQYEQGYKDVWNSNPPEYPCEYANVCHPLAQLMDYMISNACRYGILSSATRSYFCFLDGDGSQDNPYRCQVSDAFFVGEPNYIKAWVYMYDMGYKFKSSTPLRPDWKPTSSKDPSPGMDFKMRAKDDKGKDHDREDDEQSSGAEGSGDRKSGGGQKFTQLPISGLKLPLPADGDGLPYVAEANIEFMESIGHGFHGTAFRVRVNGAEAALKQFDANKGGIPGFLKEVSAYVQMKRAWSVLVPELLFVSESWMGNILHLGLQLGRSPEWVDYHEWQQVLSSLEEQYGVHHNDADDIYNSNTVLIPDKASPGGDRLAIIDFEDCDLLDPPNLPQC